MKKIIPVVQLAEFLFVPHTYECFVKLKGSPVACYLSVIAMGQDPATNSKLAVVPELHAIIKGFRQHNQVQ